MITPKGKRRKALRALLDKAAGKASVKAFWKLSFVNNDIVSFFEKEDLTLIQRLISGILRSISIGDKDSEKDSSVEHIQSLLLERGYRMSSGADGVFGPQTKRAVINFVNNNKSLVSDGINGEVTLSVLDALNSPEAKGPTILVDLPCEGGVLDCFLEALSTKESGGNYSALNNESRAYGKYQIMPDNWPSWSRDVFGETVDQTPENQEAVAKFKICEYYKELGDWWLVAVKWYSGGGGVARMERLRAEGDLSEARRTISYKGGDTRYSGIASYADKVTKMFFECLGQPYEADHLGSPAIAKSENPDRGIF